MNSLQDMINAKYFEWIFDDELTEPSITTKVREMVDASVMSKIKASLPTEAKTRLGMD